jgi:hypothetical protein
MTNPLLKHPTLDYDLIYNEIIDKLTIRGDDGKKYKSLLAHKDLKHIVMGLTNKEITALIKFLKIYRRGL